MQRQLAWPNFMSSSLTGQIIPMWSLVRYQSVVQGRSVHPYSHPFASNKAKTDGLFMYPQIKTNKSGRPASSVTKKKMKRLAKERKGRKAIGGDTTVTTQNQDGSSDEDDNTGDMDMSSEEEGKSETEIEPIIEVEEVGPVEEIGLVEEKGLVEETGLVEEIGTSPLSPLPHHRLSFIVYLIVCVGISSFDPFDLSSSSSHAEPASSSRKIELDNNNTNSNSEKAAGIRPSTNPFSANPNNRLQQQLRPLIRRILRHGGKLK